MCPVGLTLSCALQAKLTTSVKTTAFKGLGARNKKVTLGELTDSLRPGQAKRVKFKLTKRNSALFRKLKKLRMKLSVSVSTPGGAPGTRFKTLTLTAPKKKR